MIYCAVAFCVGSLLGYLYYNTCTKDKSIVYFARIVHWTVGNKKNIITRVHHSLGLSIPDARYDPPALICQHSCSMGCVCVCV